ncbi:RNA polymerase sigma-70 factor, ECF subfamily [plant metagenome]|uniref:RNA polymerase sigma-70 factor, ECF subfamily n=1 Tax=plant metagenome TaxID=1297885 RepID=A0A484RWC3_9ZZZZ
MADEPSFPDLESLYCSHHGWLQGWLRRRLGNACDAADLAQDAFLRLMQAPRRFGSAPEARAYLRTTANNLCVDLWRRRQIEQAWLEALAVRAPTVVPSAEHHAMVLQALQEIDAMLARLPRKAARAFVLAVAGDMTHREVAATLGVSTRTVTTYVAQAMLHCLRLEAKTTAQDLPDGARMPLAVATAPDLS